MNRILHGAHVPARSLVLVLALASGAAFAPAAHAARDPMRPPQVATSHGGSRVAPEPVLTAVMGTAASRVAIVNGRVVRDGDTVDGARIVAVFDDGIRYIRGGTTRELRLPRGAAVKRPARAPAAGSGSGR